MIGLYHPGHSLLHRAPAGGKLLALAVVLAVVAVLRDVPVVTAGLLLFAGLAAASRVGVRTIAAQLRPVLWFGLAAGAFQWFVAGPRGVYVVVGALVVAVGLAALVTLTTPTEDLLDAVVAGAGRVPVLRRRVDPERFALLLALTIRSVPVLMSLAADVQQARQARGAGRSVRAFAVPFLIRTVRYADRLGEALAARGIGDDSGPDRVRRPGPPPSGPHLR